MSHLLVLLRSAVLLIITNNVLAELDINLVQLFHTTSAAHYHKAKPLDTPQILPPFLLPDTSSPSKHSQVSEI